MNVRREFPSTEPRVLVITGIMAAGKSTVAQRLTERFPCGVHLRGDVFRRMIVNGRIEMTPSADTDALEQLRLRYRLATTAADLYCRAGFTVVYQDVILGPALQEVVSTLAARWPTYVVVLCPSAQTVAEREAAREKKGYSDWTPTALDDELRTNTPRLGLWLDTSSLSVEGTVEAILTRLLEAAV